MLNFTVEVRDATLTRVGQLRLEDITITFTDRYNNVGDWVITMVPQHPLAPVLSTPGAGIIVTDIDTSEVLMSGPVTDIQNVASSDDPQGTLTITGASDDVIAGDHLAYADPTKADPATTTLVEDVRTGPAETLLHEYVDANVGPSAPDGRRIEYLTMGDDAGRGSTQTQRATYPVMGVLLSDIATPESLGFRFRQVAAAVQFQTYAVTDRSATVRLDIRNNTLASYTTDQAPATATRIIVAGKPADDTDPDSPRPTIEVSSADSVASETAWNRRIEVFQDERSTSDPVELAQQGASALADSGLAQLSVQAVPMNDTTMVYGKDWGLGDKIAVVVDGVELVSIVTGVVIKADSNGILMGALIGDPSVLGDGNTGLETRVSNLERNTDFGSGGGSGPSMAEIVNLIYPVGSVYISATPTSPATLFGGTWTQLQDRFLVAAGTAHAAASTGGAASATLTTANMPSHTHTFSATAASTGAHMHNVGRDIDGATSNPAATYSVHGDGSATAQAQSPTSSAGAHTHTVSGTTAAAGTATPTAVPTLPPYLAVFMWQRTA